MIRPRGPRFEFGHADTGRLVLTRDDGSTAVCGVVIVRGVSVVVDNEDSTSDLVFDGS